MVMVYLVHNQAHIKELVAPYTKQRNDLMAQQPVEFHDDIEKQYLNLVREAATLDVAKTLNVNLVNVKMVLEQTNLKAYLEA